MTEQIPPIEEQINPENNTSLKKQEELAIDTAPLVKTTLDDVTLEKINLIAEEAKRGAHKEEYENSLTKQVANAQAKKDTGGEKTTFQAAVVEMPKNRSFLRKVSNFTLGLLSLGAVKATAEVKSSPIDSSKNKIEKKISINNESHKIVNSELCHEWNKYIDWLAAKGLKGNESLDHNGKGIEMVKQYMAENPGTILSPEVIDDIQEEFVKYREYTLNEIKSGISNFGPGVTEENYMRALSIVDGIPGQRTTSFRFPESYLLTFEKNKLLKKENQGFANLKKGNTTVSYNEIAKNK